MKKDLEYYLSLGYRIEVDAIPAEKGGGYVASLPELGRFAVCADGETVEEAIHNLEGMKRERLTDYLERGIAVPEPSLEETEYSGHFVVRIPKQLHRDLALRAKKNGVSLNQYVSTSLAGGLQEDRSLLAYEHLTEEIRSLRAQVCGLPYSMEPISFGISLPPTIRADDLDEAQAV